MTQVAPSTPELDEEAAAELALLTEAVEQARADQRSIPHEEVRAWLLEVAAGNFDAPRSVAR